MVCFSTIGTSALALWANRVFIGNFTEDWSVDFRKDSWNNSLTCCQSDLVFPTLNTINNIVSESDSTLSMYVTPNGTSTTSSSISSIEDDIRYGSFRISCKIPEINGTGFGFFFFHSIAEEIDIEILSHEASSNKVRVAVQPIIRNNLGQASTLSQSVLQINKSITLDFIEYRFDWFKDRVEFYIDGLYYTSLTTNVPHSPGKVIVNHRSNGNPNWTKGPPEISSRVVIKYIEMYFNTTKTNGECLSEKNRDRKTREKEELKSPDEIWYKKYKILLITGGIIVLLIICIIISYICNSKPIPVIPSSSTPTIISIEPEPIPALPMEEIDAVRMNMISNLDEVYNDYQGKGNDYQDISSRGRYNEK